MNMTNPVLIGARTEVSIGDEAYPEAFTRLANPPKKLYLIGNPEALEEGVAIGGSRKGTPYGVACARIFAEQTAKRGITVITGGALGCCTAAMEAALEAGGKVVAILGGGLDAPYPAQNVPLFQRVIDAGGVIVSEHDWGFPTMPYALRARNYLIANLAKATLVVEAGLPSGTFYLADAALTAGREVLTVPGSILDRAHLGANALLEHGATPIWAPEVYDEALCRLFALPRGL